MKNSIAVIGGGVAGLFTAFYLNREGFEISVFDKGECGHGATWEAAGMLAPVNELEFQETSILHAGKRSIEMYEKEVFPVLGDIGPMTKGSIEVALTEDDLGYLKRVYEFQQKMGLDVEWLNANDLNDREPFLSHRLPGGIYCSTDLEIDQRLMVGSLKALLIKNGVKILESNEVKGWEMMAEGVRVFTTNGPFEFGKIIVSAGVGGFEMNELPYKIYPVRGEMIAVAPPEFPFLKHVVRIRNKVLGDAYIVPKDGRILLGSTSEEKGHQVINTAGGVMNILRKCYAAVPGLFELQFYGTGAGLRPSTLNRLPIIDVEENGRVFHLNGLYRHGILLGPFAGKAMAQLVAAGTRMEGTELFRIRE